MSNYTDVDLVSPAGPFVGSTTGCSAGWTSSVEARRKRIPELNPVVATADRGDEATQLGAWLLCRQRLMRDLG